MKFILFAFFIFVLTSCATITNNYCLRNRYPLEFSKKFEPIKNIAMEEAINSGIVFSNKNDPYIIKPNRYNRWKGEITYNKRSESQAYFSVKFDRNRVCFKEMSSSSVNVNEKSHTAVISTINRVQKLR